MTVKTLNGAECLWPLPIDGIGYLGKANGQNPHRVRHIEGHCKLHLKRQGARGILGQ